LIGYNNKPALSGDLIDCCVFCLALDVGLRVMQNSFVYSPSRQHSMLSTESSKNNIT